MSEDPVSRADAALDLAVPEDPNVPYDMRELVKRVSLTPLPTLAQLRTLSHSGRMYATILFFTSSMLDTSLRALSLWMVSF